MIVNINLAWALLHAEWGRGNIFSKRFKKGGTFN